MNVLTITKTAPTMSRMIRVSVILYFAIFSMVSSAQTVNFEACRAKISDIVCVANPSEQKHIELQRSCLAGGEQYAKDIEAVFDHYPSVIKASFCSLKRIFIETSYGASAYAKSNIDGSGAYIGLNKHLLDSKVDLATWLSWKEQLSMGQSLSYLAYTKELPFFTSISNDEKKVNELIYYLIAHEVAHLLDHSNALNRFRPCKTGVCSIPVSQTFAYISWLKWDEFPNSQLRDEDQFVGMTSFCFYKCTNDFIEAEEVDAIYESFHETSFISTYASGEPGEDFADTFAYLVLIDFLQMEINLNVGSEVYKIHEKLRSKKLYDKYQFVWDFLTRDEIRLP